MTRTKTFDRKQALNAAMLVFWRQGYVGTSIQALEQAMQLKRTSIYNAFGNKRKLFQCALDHYLETVLRHFFVVLEQADSAEQALKNALHAVIELHFCEHNPGGCMVVLSLLEKHQHDEATGEMLNKALKQLRDAILIRLKKEHKEENSNRLTDQEIANQVIALISGMFVLAQADFSKVELGSLIDSTLRSIFRNDIT